MTYAIPEDDEIIVGDAYIHDFILEADDQNTPENLTGQTFSVKIFDHFGGTEQIVAAATALVTNGPGGTVRVFVPATVIQMLALTQDDIYLRLRWDDIETTVLGWSRKLVR